MQAMRVHQWVKNLLLFVPLLTSHQIADPSLVARVAWAALAFSLCASAVYILNDLLDIEPDRLHPVKKHRPFASGSLPARIGWVTLPLALIAALIVAVTTCNRGFLWILLTYLGVTTAYSLVLKRLAVLDILVLAGLYTLRLLAGGVAVDIEPSPWLLAFSSFLFLTLAFAKRFAEINVLAAHGQQPSSRRQYVAADQAWLGTFGAVSGYLAVLVFALYIYNSPEVADLYPSAWRLWLICPLLLYGVTRLWGRAYRGQIPDDPIATVAGDPASYAVAALILAIIWWASLTPSTA